MTLTNPPYFLVSSQLLLNKLRQLFSDLQLLNGKSLPGELSLKTDAITLYIAGIAIGGVGVDTFDGYTSLKQLNNLYNILTYIGDQPITLVMEGPTITIKGIII
jgi:hypothetical protein